MQRVDSKQGGDKHALTPRGPGRCGKKREHQHNVQHVQQDVGEVKAPRFGTVEAGVRHQ